MHVYFIQTKDSYRAIKIGKANSIMARLADMQVNNPAQLFVRGFIVYKDSHSALKAEKALHKLFKKARIRGEWYKPIPELLKFIDDNCQPNSHDAAILLSTQWRKAKSLSKKSDKWVPFSEDLPPPIKKRTLFKA